MEDHYRDDLLVRKPKLVMKPLPLCCLFCSVAFAPYMLYVHLAYLFLCAPLSFHIDTGVHREKNARGRRCGHSRHREV